MHAGTGQESIGNYSDVYRQLSVMPKTPFKVSPKLLSSKKYAPIQLNYYVNNAIFVMKTDASG